MKSIGKTFLSGLITVLPIMITIYIVIWFAAAAESVFTGKRPGHNHKHRMTGAELLTIRDAKISQLRDYHSASGT